LLVWRLGSSAQPACLPAVRRSIEQTREEERKKRGCVKKGTGTGTASTRKYKMAWKSSLFVVVFDQVIIIIDG